MFISLAKSRTVSGSSVTPRVNRISALPCAERTSSLPHQPRPIIATSSIDLVPHARGRAGLLERMRPGERLERHARCRDALHGRKRRGVDVEEAGARRLAHKTEVRHRHAVAMRELAGLLVAREMSFHRGEPFADP